MSIFAQIGGQAPHSPLDMIFGGDLTAQVILAITALFSLASWVVIFWKLGQFRRVRRAGRRFEMAMQGAHRLEDIYKSVLRLPESPYTAIFREGVNFFSELRPGALREEGPVAVGLSEVQLEALRMMMEKQEDEQVEMLSHGLPWLAIIGVVSPLLGLLGTVIGVMDAFIGLGASGAANIGAVAPGIALALVATVAGLIAAIPAVIAYNLFVARVNSLASQMEGFITEFIGTLAREGRL
ncbi:MAG: MotA/TolQ/ExbB proton channel family protein [Gemmatimonadetes bacterium]|nr:MotA/TolQ/ExbB proton channel family protein [Gemmatimonadota bacterium]